jgi:hypothetical protein
MRLATVCLKMARVRQTVIRGNLRNPRFNQNQDQGEEDNSVHKKTAPGLEPECGSLWLRSLLGVAAARTKIVMLGVGAMGIGTVGVCSMGVQTVAFQPMGVPGGSAALRVFGRLEVTHFDVFLSISHISCPAVLG